MDVEDRPRLCIRTGQIIQVSLETLCIFYNWGRTHWTISFQKELLRIIDIPTVFQDISISFWNSQHQSD